MMYTKKPALISIGEEDQIFPQLPSAEQQELLCKPLYPDMDTGELSLQERLAIRRLCKEAAATVFIVNGNCRTDLACMKELANYYCENHADFIIAVCQLEKNNHKNDDLFRYLCQKANGIYFIHNNYVYWHLAIYLCWSVRAFRLHTKAPEAQPSDFAVIRKVFPRQANQIIDVFDTYSSENEENTIVDNFLANKVNLQKLKDAYTGYCYLTTVDGSQGHRDKLKELHQRLCEATKDDHFFLTVFELGTVANTNSMLTVVTKKMDI